MCISDLVFGALSGYVGMSLTEVFVGLVSTSRHYEVWSSLKLVTQPTIACLLHVSQDKPLLGISFADTATHCGPLVSASRCLQVPRC